MLTDVDACDGTRGLYGHRIQSALGADWEKNRSPHRGFEPAFVLRLALQWDAVPAE